MRALEVVPEQQQVHDALSAARDTLLELHRLSAAGVGSQGLRLAFAEVEKLVRKNLEEHEWAAFDTLRASLDETGRVDEDQFKHAFDALHDVHDDFLLAFQVVPLPISKANLRARQFETKILRSFAMQGTKLRERRLSLLKDYIYKHPGHYVLEIYRHLSEQESFHLAYPTLHSDVVELSRRGEILTIGLRQGIKRYCFPHPAKIKDRKRYFGHLFPLVGTIQRDVTRSFTTTSALAHVYVLNHQMAPVGVVTPATVSLPESATVEGFGPLLAWSSIQEKYGLVPKEELPKELKNAVVATQLEYTTKAGTKLVQIPKEFLAR